jgi:hypothetical protein
MPNVELETTVKSEDSSSPNTNNQRFHDYVGSRLASVTLTRQSLSRVQVPVILAVSIDKKNNVLTGVRSAAGSMAVPLAIGSPKRTAVGLLAIPYPVILKANLTLVDVAIFRKELTSILLLAR